MPDRLTLLVPMTTPFDARGEVDLAAFAENISSMLAAGADGIVAAGSTGEAALLDEPELEVLVRAAREATPSTATLVVGTGRESTRDTVAVSRRMEALGADAVMVRPPCYYGGGLDDDALIAHYRAVADASALPIMLYNIPKYTPVHLSPSVVEALAGHERIMGLKDSSGDMEAFMAYRAAGPNLSLYVGSLGHAAKAVTLGADGGVLAAACFVPREVRRLLDASQAGDEHRAAVLADSLQAVGRDIVAVAGIPGIKYAMDLAGFRGGPPRPPLQPLGSDARQRVEAALDRARHGSLTLD